MRALVIGATGAVGSITVRELEQRGHFVTTVGRSQGDLRVDLRTRVGIRTLRDVSTEHDVVVNTSGIEEPGLTKVGAPALVDVSATAAYLSALRAATPPETTTVLGAGLVPGLSTVLLAALSPARGAELDLGVMLGTGEQHGAAAVQWTADLVGAEVRSRPESAAVHNFRAAIRLRGPDGRERAHHRADFPDHELLAGRGVDIRSWLALTSPAATAALGVAARWPILRSVVSRAPHVGSDAWHLVARDRDAGVTLQAAGRGQSRATAVMTVLAAEHAVVAPGLGAVTMADLITLDEALAAL